MKPAIICVDHAHGLFVERRRDLDETGWEDGRRAAGEKTDDEMDDADDRDASGKSPP